MVLKYSYCSLFIHYVHFFSFFLQNLGLYSGECSPFVVDGLQVGVVRPDITKELLRYPEVFAIKEKPNNRFIELNPAFRDYNERSEHVDHVLRQFRKDNVFITLKGWRDEVSKMITIE